MSAAENDPAPSIIAAQSIVDSVMATVVEAESTLRSIIRDAPVGERAALNALRIRLQNAENALLF